MPRLPGLDLLDELKINNVETTGPPVLVQELCFAVAEWELRPVSRTQRRDIRPAAIR